MNKDIKTKIENYVLGELEHLKSLDKQEEGHNDTRTNSVKNISTLVELLQKEDINNNELHLETRKIDGAEIKNNSDQDLKVKELDMNSKRDIELRSDRIIKVITDTAVVVVPIVFYNVWMNKGFKFEETGTYTSNTFKNMFSKFKPTK
jgi:hypothetical protein